MNETTGKMCTKEIINYARNICEELGDESEAIRLLANALINALFNACNNLEGFKETWAMLSMETLIAVEKYYEDKEKDE